MGFLKNVFRQRVNFYFLHFYVKFAFLDYIIILNIFWCLEIFIFKMILEGMGNQLESMENYLQGYLMQP